MANIYCYNNNDNKVVLMGYGVTDVDVLFAIYYFVQKTEHGHPNPKDDSYPLFADWKLKKVVIAV